jgi:hypothetical protein
VGKAKPPARFEGYVPEFSVEKRKFSLEYRVIAINKSGEGSPSNTVMVVL